jgi:hypothetical protein
VNHWQESDIPPTISGVTRYVNVLYGQISKFGDQLLGAGVNTGNGGGGWPESA